MDKIKIVRIISRLNIGGPAIHTILLSGALNARGYEDTLVCGSVSESEGDMMDMAADNDVRPVIIKELQRDIALKSDFIAFMKLLSLIRKEKPDIVHTHTAKAGALGRLAAICAGTPVRIHTFHGHVLDGYFSPLKARIFILIERILALFTDKIIAVSENVKEELSGRYKVAAPIKCAVISLGLDLDKFMKAKNEKGSFRKKIGAGDDVMLVGLIGRLVPIKNHRMFLSAAKRMTSLRPGRRVRYVVIGDGELRKSLEAYAGELNITGSVIFTGWIKDLPAVYQDLDVVALTSLNEGTPLSIIEAMASARPVVATDVGGVRDLIKDGETGFLVKSNDVKGFCEKLTLLLDNPGTRELFGTRGRDSVRRYSKERLASDVENIYAECLKNKRKKGV